MKNLKTKAIVISLICVIIIGSMNLPLLLENYTNNTNKPDKAKIDNDKNDNQDKVNILPKISSDGISSVNGDEKSTLEKALKEENFKSLISGEIFSPSTSNSLKSSGESMDVSITSHWQELEDISFQNIYKASYSVLDPITHSISVGPYGTGDGVFGSDYSVAWSNNWNNYPGGQSQFETNFPNLIEHNTFYGQCGTSVALEDPADRFKGVDLGLQNLLERIGGLQKVSYRNYQGNVDFNLYALPTSPNNILINSQYNSEYHKPIILKVEETWEAYSLNSYQTKVYDGETETIVPNEYPLFTLYVPHIKIEFDLEPAFAALINERASAVDMGTISKNEFDKIMGYQKNVVSALGFINKFFSEKGASKGFMDKLQGQLKGLIGTAGMICGALGWINEHLQWWPEDVTENLKMASKILGFVQTMVNLFILGEKLAETLIGLILTAVMFAMKQNIEAVKAISQAKYDATLNYFKAAIYAAVQISQYILQRCQPFIYVNKEGINENYHWYVDGNIYNAFDANSDELKPLISYNSERWGASAVYAAFTKPLTEITDYNGADGVNWNDIGYDSFLTAHMDVRNEEINNGEPRAKYYVYHCLSTFITSLVIYLGLSIAFKYDSKEDILPDYAYSADITYIQEDFSTGPDEIRTRIFSAFATFGCAYNIFSNTYLRNTLWSVDNAPYNKDTDGDELMDYQEVTLGSNPCNPDSDGDYIDDGAEYKYWNNPKYMQGSTPTEAVDSDGDYFLDKEEIYWFGTNPLTFNEDLDADGLSVAEENTRGTNPRDPDTDDDYLIDGMEVHHFNTNPKIQDSDGDGIWDGIEAYHFMTNPTNGDTDGDGLSDYNELAGVEVTLTVNDQTINVISISDPCKSDTDGDGLGDGNEILTIGTLPGFQDTDSDGLSDGWEFSNGFDPLSYREPQFQFTYDLPPNPTVQKPGAFSWSVKDYYPRTIQSVSVKYKAPGESWETKSAFVSGSFNLDPIVGTHQIEVVVTNDQGIVATYQISVYVTEIIEGPPTIYGSNDIVYIFSDSNIHQISWTIYDFSVVDPLLAIYLDYDFSNPQYVATWANGAQVTGNINPGSLSPGIHVYTIVVWEYYSGNPNSYVMDDIVVWVLETNIQQVPAKIGSHKYSDYMLHGEDYRFGETEIICEQIHISTTTDVIVGIWNQNPMTGEAPFEGNARYFAIQGKYPAVFESEFYTIFTVSLPENYNPNTDNYILLKWDNVNNKWIHTEFSFTVDWINGIYRFRIMEWGIFALGKYVLPTILKPDDLVYIYNAENIVTHSLSWTLVKSMIKIPYCAIYFNFDWEHPLGEIYGWVEGQQIIVNVDSNVLPPGVYTVTAVFFDPIASTVIRHDVCLWVLPTSILSLNDMASAKLYYPGTYENVPLGDLEIINITTLGATIVGGIWDQNPMTGADPFVDGVYFAIATDVPDYRISYNDPNYPFVISVPLPENYDPNNNILTLLVWNEAEGRWIFTDFKIEVDLSSNTVRITMEYMGIFALGVVKPDDTTPPNIVIEYLYGDETDGSPGIWNVSFYDEESGNNFAATRIYIDGELVGISCGEYKVPSALGIRTILVEVVTNNPINPTLTSCSLPIGIIDDDTTSPTIDYIYTGDGTDKDPGAIIVTVSDASGLSNDPSGSYPVSNASGTYTFTFEATDDDNDRPGDNLTATIIVTIEIVSIKYVELIDTIYANSYGDIEDLKYDDGLYYKANRISTVDNGKDALYCDPDLPLYNSLLYGPYGSGALTRYDPGWSASRGDGRVLELSNSANLFPFFLPVFVELRPMFLVRNHECPHNEPVDIEITIFINRMLCSLYPSLGIYIYNYDKNQWETLSYETYTSIYSYVLLENIEFRFNGYNLKKFDTNLNHFINPNGYVQLRILAETKNGIWGSPYHFVDLMTDQCNVKATYQTQSKIDFIFEPDLLNGENDFYLFFQAITTDGIAYLQINGVNVITIDFTGITIGTLTWFLIADVNSITIDLGTSSGIDIDYLYLRGKIS